MNVLEADRSHVGSHHSDAAAYQTPADNDQVLSQHQDQAEPNEQNAAPLYVLRDVATDSGFPTHPETESQDFDRAATNSPSQIGYEDIIFKKLVSPQEAFSLLALFQTHYGRWTTFNKETPIAVLLEEMRKFPLLLTACCLIAAR